MYCKSKYINKSKFRAYNVCTVSRLNVKTLLLVKERTGTRAEEAHVKVHAIDVTLNRTTNT